MDILRQFNTMSEKIRKCSYPLSIRSIKELELSKRVKIVKAMFYDFLKKNRLLDEYYDCYVKFHEYELSPQDLESKGLKPFKFYLNKSARICCERGYAIRDFIYNAETSFVWDEEIREKAEMMDSKWTKLVDSLGL